MPEIQRLRLDHGPAVLAFEEENRAYFAASIPDRGDDFFADFEARHRELLAEQEAGGCHFHVLVEDGGQVVGRINLVDVADGSAELGFRMAEKSAGRGLAQYAVRQIFDLAVTEYGLTTLRARATLDNARSRAVLARTGFVPAGEIVLNGRPAITFTKALS
ncbi:MAG TPA: GNAT family N-acetyltransferase [Streptosporangiaceae bacterium]|jgi:ribosomal-protein-alanine N-acetyltransferase